jgi:glycosyltransferase involved in cell wall biosynthesis
MGAEFDKKFNLKPVVVTGFPYAFPYYFRVFDFLENKNDFIFVLPKFWSAKAGKIQIKLESKTDLMIVGAKSFSYGGKSFLSGIFKGWMPAIALKLPYFKSKYRSQILYSCSEPNLLTTLYNGIFAKLFGFKHVIFTWQNVVPGKRMAGLKLILSNWLVRLNLKLSDGVICGNKKAELIIQSFNSKVKTIVCPISGVDIEKFKPGIQSDWKTKLAPSGEKIILFYGALEKRKGVDILINAFKEISSKIKSILVVVGTGDQKQNLLKLSENLNLNNKIIFIDWMKNDSLPALLNVADIFVYPSVPDGGWEEQFGYAMAEASASGVPVVASKSGSIDEVVVDGETGYLVPPNDHIELAGKIIQCLESETLRKQMGERGRIYITENFSHKIIADKISIFFREF